MRSFKINKIMYPIKKKYRHKIYWYLVYQAWSCLTSLTRTSASQSLFSTSDELWPIQSSSYFYQQQTIETHSRFPRIHFPILLSHAVVEHLTFPTGWSAPNTKQRPCRQKLVDPTINSLDSRFEYRQEKLKLLIKWIKFASNFHFEILQRDTCFNICLSYNFTYT